MRLFRRKFQHLWLISDGRSGSTWLSALVNHAEALSEYFEPCHSVYEQPLFGEPTARFLHCSSKERDRYTSLYRDVFSGDYKSERSGPKFPDRTSVFVKDINAMLIAREVSNSLHKVKIVCLYRHPIDVASSKVSLRDWHWFDEPFSLVGGDASLEHILRKQMSIIQEARTLFEKFIVMWCINYFVIISQFGKSITYIPYDSILERPEYTFRLVVDGIVPSVPFERDKFYDAFSRRSVTDRIPDTPKFVPSDAELSFARRAIDNFRLGAFVSRVASKTANNTKSHRD